MLASEIPVPRASSRTLTASSDESVGVCVSVAERLGVTKLRVPETRTRVGARRWNEVVNASSVMERLNRDRVVINRAYHKMHEIIMSCVLPTVRTSVHLCEAPGGFVQCVSEHLRDPEGWTWHAVTRGDGIAPDDSFRLCDNGCFSLIDVMVDEDRVTSTLRLTFPNGADLVTADGAVEMNHNRIEEEHFPLALTQTRIALSCLARGGTFVLKMFECLRPCTRDLVAQLTRCFDSVSIIKPYSSRPTNSERYIVCRSFSGQGTVDDQVYVHADGWRHEYDEIVCRMANTQIMCLERAFASV